MAATVLLSWSGGKDSALALARLRKDPRYTVVGLLVTFRQQDRRTPFHYVHESLIRAQAAALQLPVVPFYIPENAPNTAYEMIMRQVLLQQAVDYVAFGDIFLEDLREYRERIFASLPQQLLFPLWGESTTDLLQEFFAAQWKSVVVCIDASKLDESLLGQPLTPQWIKRLPPTVDPCGENGEFHTFVWAGPLFTHPLPVRCTGTVEIVPPYRNCLLVLDDAGEKNKSFQMQSTPLSR